MGPLREWLDDVELDTFRRAYLGRVPCAKPGTAKKAVQSCTWQALDDLLSSHPVPDVLVVARGEALSMPAPRSLTALRTLFDRGIGIVVRHPERQSAAIRQLTTAFAADVAGEQRVLLFATPSGTHGFGWHYDPEDVFIVQNDGDKEYYFRRNTIDPAPGREGQPDFSTFARETTPWMSCRLLRGDFLYLPRGFWHVAHPHADSLSVSIGVFPAT